MAIAKEVENEYGVNFTYHKLHDVRVINDDGAGVCVVMTVFSWIDKEARINGKQPTKRQCIIDGADFAMTPFYALLKAKFPAFTDGENDMDNSFKGEIEPGKPHFFDQTAQGKLFGTWEESKEAAETTDSQIENNNEGDNEL